jgi:hypothetical protein
MVLAGESDARLPAAVVPTFISIPLLVVEPALGAALGGHQARDAWAVALRRLHFGGFYWI